MNLDEGQRKKVAEWIGQGLKLSEIQTRIASELGVSMTYMDVRLLVDDLKLIPKDVEPSKPSASPIAAAGSGAATPVAGRGPSGQAAPAGQQGAGISVSVDQIARPGAIVSGQVTFSDGNRAAWYLDQTGRLGLVPEQAGYRPPAADLQKFQQELDVELRKMGF
jgi:hypothetical protein